MDRQGTLADGVETRVDDPIVGLPIGSIIAGGRIRLCPVPTRWNMSLAEPRDLFTEQTGFIDVFLAVDNLPGNAIEYSIVATFGSHEEAIQVFNFLEMAKYNMKHNIFIGYVEVQFFLMSPA